MTLKSQLQNATQNINLVDTDAIVEQGRKAFRAIFTKSANPFKTDRDRNCWNIGYTAEEQKWREAQQRERERERGQDRART